MAGFKKAQTLICTKYLQLKRISVCICFVFILSLAKAQEKQTIIATNSENDLIPEGIAVDTRTGSIYVSSIAKQKIIVIDEKGKHRDFISTNQHGFLEGLGMKVDASRNLLWALSDKHEGKWYTCQVHAFDLTTGQPAHFYSLKDTVPHLFNDLEMDVSGNIYITDTHFGAIYFIDTKKKKLELFLKTPLTKYPNGVSLGKENQLYIATYQNGPVKIDLATKEVSLLKGYTDSVISHGLDGLVYWNHSLIGIYNISGQRSGNLVVKYGLNDKGDAIIKEDILEKGNPHFYEPTTSALSDKYLYVLANSHLATYNANKQSTKGKEDQLKPVTIVRYELF